MCQSVHGCPVFSLFLCSILSPSNIYSVMKSLFPYLLIAFFPVFLWGQTGQEPAPDRLEIAVNTGIDFITSGFHSGNFQFIDNQNYSSRGVTGVLSVSMPLSERFYIGAEAGMLSGSNLVVTNVRPKTEDYKITYFGNYEENRFHVFLVPEIRLLPKNILFLKAGVGISKTFNSHFTDGNQLLAGGQSYDLKGESQSGSGFLGGFVGAGFQVPIIKKLGIKLEVRRYILPHGATSDDQIIFHFDHLAVQGGLTFTL